MSQHAFSWHNIQWIPIEEEPLPVDLCKISFVYSQASGAFEVPVQAHEYTLDTIRKFLPFVTHWCKKEVPEDKPAIVETPEKAKVNVSVKKADRINNKVK